MSELGKAVLDAEASKPAKGLPLSKAFSLMTPREQRNSLFVVAVFLASSLTMALSVASVYPFLLVLTQPGVIQTNDILSWVHRLFGSPSTQLFAIILGTGVIALLLFSAALQILRVYMVERFTQMRIHTISVRLLEVFMSQPMIFFMGRNTGDMAKGILNETREVVQQFFRPAAEFLAGITSTLSVVIVLLIMAPMMTFIAVGITVCAYALVYVFTHGVLSRIGMTRVKANSERYRISREALSGIKDIKVAGTERYFISKYSVFSHQAALVQSRANIINTVPRYLVEAIVFVGIVVIPLLYIDEMTQGGGEVLSGVLPQLGLMAIGAQRLMPEIQKVYRSLSVMRFGAAAVDSVEADMKMSTDPALRAKPGGPGIRLNDALELRDVSFTYPTADGPSLIDISIRVKKGERVGIVGTTGAGKSTLADLVLGLLTPQTGQMLVDGRPLTLDDIRPWQRSIGYVPQHIFLSDATIAENIALGSAGDRIDRDKVEAAGQVAQLDEFVRTELPNGYDTAIGENGVRLSGGQRQRIGVARALYRDADLIVFDEATSALDSVTENELVAAIDALPGTKTLLIIAHRLSTVRKCDRIIVMNGGRIVASGNWDENLRDSAEFRELVSQKSMQ